MDKEHPPFHALKVAPEGLGRVYRERIGNEHPCYKGEHRHPCRGETRTIGPVKERKHTPGTHQELDDNTDIKTLPRDKGEIQAVCIKGEEHPRAKQGREWEEEERPKRHPLCNRLDHTICHDARYYITAPRVARRGL